MDKIKLSWTERRLVRKLGKKMKKKLSKVKESDLNDEKEHDREKARLITAIMEMNKIFEIKPDESGEEITVDTLKKENIYELINLLEALIEEMEKLA